MFLKSIDGDYVNKDFIVRVYIVGTFQTLPGRSYTEYIVYAELTNSKKTGSTALYRSENKEECEKFIERTFCDKTNRLNG